MQKIIIHGSKLKVKKEIDQHAPVDRHFTVIVEGDMRSPSDGYHTFDELYDHRITLYIALCRACFSMDLVASAAKEAGAKNISSPPFNIWRSKYHSDGEICFGTGTQYVLGIGKEKGTQITYHIPVERWSETDFAETLEKAPEYDGHTSADVITRLKNI